MIIFIRRVIAPLFCVMAAALASCAHIKQNTPPAATFDSFTYTGNDKIFTQKPAADEYQNPILAGFYPDPSITRADNAFYLTTSSFSYFPGAPIFKSTDLVHWQQLGHILNRPTQFNPKRVGISRGMFAPTLRYHDGTFYLIPTAVDAGGNFMVTAKNPTGPWSAPIWLPQVGGIDPDIFFDDDGRIYITHNDAPPGEPEYQGHRAIWMWEYDPQQKTVIKNSRRLLVNGGTDIRKQPVWIEAPHIVKRNGWYYLLCAQGGTGDKHSEVVFRTRSLQEPFVAYKNNPILTQRDLAIDRDNPITSAGHADIVQAPNGQWWAVFLATRSYDQTAYNTGRETFMLSVSWRNGWPHILPAKTAIPYHVKKPELPPSVQNAAPLTGNFTWRDDFTKPVLSSRWVMQRSPSGHWYHLNPKAGTLTLDARTPSLDTLKQPAFLGRRQQHMRYSAQTVLELPRQTGYSAGLAVFQSEQYHYYLGVKKTDGNGYQVFLEQARGTEPKIIRRHRLAHISGRTVTLSVKQNAGQISFYIETNSRSNNDTHITLAENIDGKMLSTQVAGGFVGTFIGIHARLETTP